MIEIRIAKKTDITILALLGRVTYTESHGHFIDDKNDLLKYLNQAFSVTKTKEDFKNTDNLFYIISVDDLPVGYAKLVINAKHESIASQNNCRLERIYILNDFIPLKMGQQFFILLEEKVRELQLDTMWLSVYVKNKRAIRFYQKNEFKSVGKLSFLVNQKKYENIVFSKRI